MKKKSLDLNQAPEVEMAVWYDIRGHFVSYFYNFCVKNA